MFSSRFGDLLVLLGLFGLSACAAGGVLGRPEAKTPEAAYQNAMEDLADGLYPEALAGSWRRPRGSAT